MDNATESIEVSILCNTYNHQLYISDAIESFLKQNTTFKYEILIYDDASTDDNQKIISSYAEKYPDIIFPYYVEENQWSKGVLTYKEYQYPRVRGKYIAFCEGDDYWTDSHKLQCQFDQLEAHPEIDICTHRVSVVQDGIEQRTWGPKSATCIIPAEEVITGGGGFVATNSIMCRSNVLLENNALNNFIERDYFWQILGSLRGGMLYIDKNMGVYRAFVKNSWTSNIKSNVEKKVQNIEYVLQSYLLLDQYTKGCYSAVINSCILESEFHKALLNNDYAEVMKRKFRKIRKRYSLRWKLAVFYRFIVGKIK